MSAHAPTRPHAADPGVVHEVPLDQIDLSDETYRFRLAIDVSDLAADIATQGQQIPAVLRVLQDPTPHYQLVCGFRRCTALTSLGAPTVRAMVLDLDDEAALRLAWSENEARQAYNDLDRAHAILKSRRAGHTMKALSSVFGLSRKQLTRLQQVAELPDVVQQALGDGRIHTTHAIVLTELLRRYPDIRLEIWIDIIAADGLSTRELRQRIHRVHRPAPSRRPLVSRDGGGAIHFHVRTLDPARMTAEERVRAVEALRAAIEALEAERGPAD